MHVHNALLNASICYCKPVGLLYDTHQKLGLKGYKMLLVLLIVM